MATPQEVLQADWQEVWHSPQPPFFLLSSRSRVFKVTILFIVLLLKIRFYVFIIETNARFVNQNKNFVLKASVFDDGKSGRKVF